LGDPFLARRRFGVFVTRREADLLFELRRFVDDDERPLELLLELFLELFLADLLLEDRAFRDDLREELRRLAPRLGPLGVRARRARRVVLFAARRFFEPLGARARRELRLEERREDALRRVDVLDLERLGPFGVRARRARLEDEWREELRRVEALDVERAEEADRDGARLEPFGARAARRAARRADFLRRGVLSFFALLRLGAFGVRALRTDLLRDVDLLAFFFGFPAPSLRARFLIPIRRFRLAIISALYASRFLM